MKLTALETGKSIQAFANIVTALIFLKHFWDYRDLNSVLAAITVWFGLYFVACVLIKWSEKKT